MYFVCLFFVFVCLFIIIIIILEALVVRQKERKKVVSLVLTEPIQTGFDRTNTTNLVKKFFKKGGRGFKFEYEFSVVITKSGELVVQRCKLVGALSPVG